MELEFLENKSPKSYTSDVVDTIRLVRYGSKESAYIHGSYTYRSQKYPGDIDIVDEAGSYLVEGKWEIAKKPELLSQKIAKKIQSICKNLESNTYMIELKAGYYYPVLEYLFPMGTFTNGVLKLHKTFVKRIKNFQNVFPTSTKNTKVGDTLNKILELSEKPNKGDYEYFWITKLCRLLFVLRWSKEEVIKGFMNEPVTGSKIELKDALLEPENHTKLSLPLVKLDLIKYIDGKFADVSAVYIIEFMKGSEIIPLSEFQISGGLTLDVEKFAFSTQEGAIFKSVKRMFAFARYEALVNKDQTYLKYAKKMSDFLSSDISLIYFAKSQLQTLVDLYETGYIQTKNVKANDQIDKVKDLLSVSLVLNKDEADKFSTKITKICKTNKKVKKLKLLKKLTKDLMMICNRVAYAWLDTMKLDPISNKFLPSKQLVKYMNDNHIFYNPVLEKQSYRSYDCKKNLL